MSRFLKLLIFLGLTLLPPGMLFAEDNPLFMMRDDALSFFRPVKGKIISVSNGKAVADIGEKMQIKKGMRLTVFREGAPFLHPVTKEPVGMMEKIIGKAEVKEAGPDTSTLALLKGDAKESDRLRISETGVRMLFYQDVKVDWSLAESYYRVLRDAKRFELIDTALETDKEAEIIAEAKRLNADVVLVLSAKEAGGDTLVKQKLIWVEDSAGFSEYEVKVSGTFVKEIKLGEEYFGPKKGGEAIYVDLPYGVRMIAAGDVDGDGKIELLLSTGKDVRFYTPGEERKISFEIKGDFADDHLWLDAMDVNGDGKAEIMVTLMRYSKVLSRIYELKDGNYSVVWEKDVFLRRMGSELFAQAYSIDEGYNGPVFKISWSEGYKKVADLSLPKSVNIYDFIYIVEPDGRKLILAYDNDGYLSLYDAGNRIWQSKEDYGGFITTFKLPSPTVMVDRGEWSVKDKLIVYKREVFAVKRVPFVGAAKGLGYTSSMIKGLWWTGASIEEKDVVDDIPGSALDFAVVGDKLIILDKPVLGLKINNLFKGENPLGSVLYIYSLKGR